MTKDNLVLIVESKAQSQLFYLCLETFPKRTDIVMSPSGLNSCT